MNTNLDQALLTLVGEIDITNADELMMCTHFHLGAPDIVHVIADLVDLTFIDAADAASCSAADAPTNSAKPSSSKTTADTSPI